MDAEAVQLSKLNDEITNGQPLNWSRIEAAHTSSILQSDRFLSVE